MKIIISEFNNKIYVFEFSDFKALRIYPLYEDAYRIGSIIIGRIRDIKADLNCCFVEMGDGNIGYLSFDNANPKMLLNRPYDGRFKQGDEILVRVIKMPAKTKPFSLSMEIEVAGDFSLVSTKGSGYFASQKLTSNIKNELIEKVSSEFEVNAFDSMACLLRTKAADASIDNLILDIKNNKGILEDILNKAKSRKLYSVIYEPEKDFVIRIKENDSSVIDEIVTDIPKVFEEVKEKFSSINVSLYNDKEIPLKVLYNLDRAYSEAVSKKVNLDCGGYLIIEPTEALTVIDVNSGKFVSKKSKNETISIINKEAAEMIHRQLLLRNISGIIIVDFINCSSDEEKELVSYMKSISKNDRVKMVVEGFTKLGLMEITRQKQYPSIYEK